jgi:membrane-bound lytic murein transglycosylase D
MSLSSLAQRTGIDPETLKELNPELVRRTTPPRLYALKVPVGKSEEALDALAAIPATERVEFRSYKIQKGDTLAKVATRYKTTPEELMDINNIASSQFNVGRTIQVPVIVQMGAATQKK